MAMTDDTAAFAMSHAVDGTTATLNLVGELDTSSARAVDRTIDEVIAAGAKTLVIDLGEISFIDSSGLRSLIRARQQLGDANDAVRLRNPQPGTMRLLEITGLQDQFRLV
jgi:anti-sigma B factor antagonist